MASTLRQRLRYRFDNLMAKGTGAQILLLAAAIAKGCTAVPGAEWLDRKSVV